MLSVVCVRSRYGIRVSDLFERVTIGAKSYLRGKPCSPDIHYMGIIKAKEYFSKRVEELQCMSAHGTPWVFLCASALVDLLSNMVAFGCKQERHDFCFYQVRDCKFSEGGERWRRGGGCRYKKFVERYMPKYKFDYGNGVSLPDKMWHILRCGIIHSFSLVSDTSDLRSCGIYRAIFLCHRREANKRNLSHLSPYRQGVLFVAEDFVDDIGEVVNHIFADANSDRRLKENVLAWLQFQPPLTSGF